MGKSIEKELEFDLEALSLSLVLGLIVLVQAWASTTPTFNQTISAAALSVDIVDSGGSTVETPTVDFGGVNFSFDYQDSHGQFATSSERVRANNPTAKDTWTVSLAGSAPGATWTDGGNTYNFDDPTGSGETNGQMSFDPSTGSITGVDGCSADHVSKGISESFEEGVTDSIDIMIASAGAATACQWDFIGAAENLLQKIPAGQVVGSYSLGMIVSIQ